MLYAFERIEGPIGARRDDYNAAMVAMNSIAPHVEKGTDLSLDKFLIKYGEREREFEEGEIGEPEVWFDPAFFSYSPDQVPRSDGLR